MQIYPGIFEGGFSVLPMDVLASRWLDVDLEEHVADGQLDHPCGATGIMVAWS